MSSLLMFLLVFAGDKPHFQHTPQGAITLGLPQQVLADPDLKRRLFSGLTATIELQTQTRVGGRQQLSYALVEIRYLVWEEQLLVRKFEPGGSITRASLGDLPGLKAWLGKNPVIIARIATDGPRATSLRVTCRIIPFSKAEARQTQSWFANLLKVPEAGSRGQADRDRKRKPSRGDDQGNGIFGVLMTTSIDHGSVVTYKWKWQLEGN